MQNTISKLNTNELQRGVRESSSWHDDYKSSPYIYIGGIAFELNEGDILVVFSQYGKIKKINLIRDKDSQKSKGFAFIGYEDPRSAILAVDNFNGIKVIVLFIVTFLIFSFLIELLKSIMF